MEAVLPNHSSLTVVVPNCCYEAGTLKDFLPQLQAIRHVNGRKMVLVTDGSTDSSADLLASYQSHPGVTANHHTLGLARGPRVFLSALGVILDAMVAIVTGFLVAFLGLIARHISSIRSSLLLEGRG